MKKSLIPLLGLIVISCSGTSLITDTSKTLVIQAQHSGTSSFTNDQGVIVTLTVATINWGHLNVISAGDDEECEAGHDVELHLEHEEDLLDANNTTLELESEEIEDFSYCNYSLEIESVSLTGIWDNGNSTGDFDLTLENLIIERAFVASHNDEVIEHPLHFHDSEELKTIIFTNTHEAWFDGLTFGEAEDDLEATIRNNIEESIAQSIGE